MVHREDGGAAGMLGRRGQREMSRPRWRRVVRRRVVRRRVVRRRVVRRRVVRRRGVRRRVVRRRGVEREAGGVPKAGDSSSAGGSIRHPKKTFRTLLFLFRGKD